MVGAGRGHAALFSLAGVQWLFVQFT